MPRNPSPGTPHDELTVALMHDERYLNVWHAYHRTYVALVNDVLRLTHPVERRMDFRGD